MVEDREMKRSLSAGVARFTKAYKGGTRGDFRMHVDEVVAPCEAFSVQQFLQHQPPEIFRQAPDHDRGPPLGCGDVAGLIREVASCLQRSAPIHLLPEAGVLLLAAQRVVRCAPASES